MGSVAIYSRTSTNMQQSGLEAQKRALVEYCKSKGIKKYKSYEDSGVSGTTKSRPALNEMMGEVEKGEISMVIVFSFSRFARSTAHLLEALDTFKRTKTEFVSISENIDTTTPVGVVIFSILAAISQFEREIIVERIRAGMANARAKNKQIGRKKERPTEAILELRGKGFTYREISKLLNVSEGTIANSIKDGKLKNDKE